MMFNPKFKIDHLREEELVSGQTGEPIWQALEQCLGKHIPINCRANITRTAFYYKFRENNNKRWDVDKNKIKVCEKAIANYQRSAEKVIKAYNEATLIHLSFSNFIVTMHDSIINAENAIQIAKNIRTDRTKRRSSNKLQLAEFLISAAIILNEHGFEIAFWNKESKDNPYLSNGQMALWILSKNFGFNGYSWENIDSQPAFAKFLKRQINKRKSFLGEHWPENL